MGKCIVKIGNKYVEWSTVVDAPISEGMNLEELKEYIQFYYGKTGLMELDERLKRVEANGTSWTDESYESAEDFCSYNRAGPDESCLSWDELVKMVNEDV